MHKHYDCSSKRPQPPAKQTLPTRSPRKRHSKPKRTLEANAERTQNKRHQRHKSRPAPLLRRTPEAHAKKGKKKCSQLLKRSGIAVYDRKSVIITAKELNQEAGMKVDLLDKFVYLLDRSDLPERISALVKHENCTMIVVHSPEELEATPGVVAFLGNFAGGAEREHRRVHFLLDRNHHGG